MNDLETVLMIEVIDDPNASELTTSDFDGPHTNYTAVQNSYNTWTRGCRRYRDCCT